MRLHGSILGTLARLCVVAGCRPGSSTDFARARAGQWVLSGVPVKESTPVTDKGEIIVRINGDEEEVVRCSLKGKGTVGPEGTGSVTESKLSSCKRTILDKERPKCEEEQSVTTTALRLPWRMQLGKTGSEDVNRLEASGGGPDWAWECRISGGTFEVRYKMECEGNEINHVSNTASGVSEFLDAGESEVLACFPALDHYLNGKLVGVEEENGRGAVVTRKSPSQIPQEHSRLNNDEGQVGPLRRPTCRGCAAECTELN